jgi:hypothetical protein
MNESPDAGPKRESKTSRPYVAVFCKVAVAWLDLRICVEREVSENTQTGSRLVKQWSPTGEVIRIRGTAYPRGQQPDGFPDKPRIVMGYAVTENVPRKLYDAWRAQNNEAPYVRSGMIVAFESLDDGAAYAKEHDAERSGLEPIQRFQKTLDDPRIPRPSTGSISHLAPDGERMAGRKIA